MDKNSPSKWSFGTFQRLRENSPIPHVIFETTSQFFFKPCITLQCHERLVFCLSLFYLLQLYMSFTKGAHQNAKFQTFHCSGEIPSNLCFDWLLLSKVYKNSAKKVQKSYVSWYWSGVQNLKKKLIFCFKNAKNLVNFDPSTKKSKKFLLWLDWSLLGKVYNGLPKRVQRSFISWHWRVMHSLKKVWPVVWKMTWGICQIFIRTLESIKIGTFMGSFWPK